MPPGKPLIFPTLKWTVICHVENPSTWVSTLKPFSVSSLLCYGDLGSCFNDALGFGFSLRLEERKSVCSLKSGLWEEVLMKHLGIETWNLFPRKTMAHVMIRLYSLLITQRIYLVGWNLNSIYIVIAVGKCFQTINLEFNS